MMLTKIYCPAYTANRLLIDTTLAELRKLLQTSSCERRRGNGPRLALVLVKRSCSEQRFTNLKRFFDTLQRKVYGLIDTLLRYSRGPLESRPGEPFRNTFDCEKASGMRLLGRNLDRRNARMGKVSTKKLDLKPAFTAFIASTDAE